MKKRNGVVARGGSRAQKQDYCKMEKDDIPMLMGKIP